MATTTERPLADALTAIKTRRAIKEYLPTEIPREWIEEIYFQSWKLGICSQNKQKKRSAQLNILRNEILCTIAQTALPLLQETMQHVDALIAKMSARPGKQTLAKMQKQLHER